MRPAIATVVGDVWEHLLVDHARRSGMARLVGRCCDPAGLADVARRADTVFIGSETPWLGRTDLGLAVSRARLVGVAADAPGARMLEAAGVHEVIDHRVPPHGMLALAATSSPRSPGSIIEITGPRGAPGRSEVALALAHAALPHRSAVVELDLDAPSIGLRTSTAPARAFAEHRVHGITIVAAPAGMEPVDHVRVGATVRAVAAGHDVTFLDAGPDARWHRVLDVGGVIVVGEATEQGIVRLARLCAGWTGPMPRLVINRHRADQDLRQVVRATGLEPSAIIPVCDPSAAGARPAAAMRRALLPLVSGQIAPS